jgi:hypothetical protein
VGGARGAKEKGHRMILDDCRWSWQPFSSAREDYMVKGYACQYQVGERTEPRGSNASRRASPSSAKLKTAMVKGIVFLDP